MDNIDATSIYNLIFLAHGLSLNRIVCTCTPKKNSLFGASRGAALCLLATVAPGDSTAADDGDVVILVSYVDIVVASRNADLAPSRHIGWVTVSEAAEGL
jgi:hypothetical protein